MNDVMNVRMSTGLKAEVEVLVNDVGLWKDKSAFVREAINEAVKKYWGVEQGDRYYCGVV